MAGPDLLQGPGRDFDLAITVGIGKVYDLQQKVRLADLLQGGPEGLDQGVGQVADKADGIGQKEGQVAGGLDPPDRGIQGGKEHVLFQDLFLVCILSVAVAQQGIHQGGLARIGIAHQGHPGDAGLEPAAPLGLPFLVDDLQLLFHLADPVLDPASVQLQLLFAGALVGQAAAAAALPGELGVHAGQAGQEILEPGGLHLEPGLSGPGSLGEYLQDDAGLVQDLCIQLLFQVADLEGGEGLVEDDHVRVHKADLLPELLHLAAAHVGAMGDFGGVLDHHGDDLQVTGLGQALELLHGSGVFFRSKPCIDPGQEGPGFYICIL